jgi:hypothetical protein
MLSACDVAREAKVAPGSPTPQPMYGPSCMMACGAGYGGCVLADDYVAAYLGARSDAGVGTCPSISGSVEVTCVPAICEGRLTDGIDRLPMLGARSIGDYFAACCYLEAASVHAFSRLREELAAHGAPRDLLDATKRAERDEVRHVALTLELAQRFGVEPEQPAPPSGRARTLFDVARENAVEGCVRETYGAVVALVRGARAEDASVRRAMRSIARDECRHAELSWRIAAWVMPRLKRGEREQVTRSMRDALIALARAEEASTGECRSFLGLPSPCERKRLVAALEQALPRLVA